MSFVPTEPPPAEKKTKRKPNRWASCIGVQMRKGNSMKQSAKICHGKIGKRKK